MNGSVAVLCALFFISAMLSTTMLVAWRTLGRPRHALTFATAFAVAACQWGLNIGWMLLWQDSDIVRAGVGLLGVGVSLLILAGFRERAGRRAPVRTAALIFAAAALVLWVGLVLGRPGWSMAMPLVARALLLVVAIAAVLKRGRHHSAAEWCMATMLGLVSLFSGAAAALTLWRMEVSPSFPEIDRWLLLLGSPAALTGLGLFAVLLLTDDLAARLRRLATSDPLTGILNRRGFSDAATRALANAARTGRPASVVIADIDRFKSVNDDHGHAAGDAVLVRMATFIAGAIRTGDIFGRLGGEEFALLLEGADEAAARDVVERIRASIETLDFGLPQPTRLTASFGIASLATSLDAALNAADRALYAAKLAGRNRVVCAGPDGLQPERQPALREPVEADRLD